MLKKKKTNKNNIEAAAVPTPKVESFPVCIFNTHHHVAKSRRKKRGREREGGGGKGEKGKRKGEGRGRGRREREEDLSLIISSGCVQFLKLLPDGIPKRFLFGVWLS